MQKPYSIEIVSDVSCPWCIIGYLSLKSAIDELDVASSVEIKWRPFELNPNMPAQGQNRLEHLQQKYGGTPEQMDANRQALVDRGVAVGYQFTFDREGRVYNTFDAHRLIHWAAEFAAQTDLKLALFDLFFKAGGNPSDHTQLLSTVSSCGLDAQLAKGVLHSDAFTAEVRAEQALSQQQGISAVPAFIFNNEYLISGGQPKETFIDVLQKLDKQQAGASTAQ